MKLNYRQGLVSYQRNSASAPLFLTQSSTSGYVDVNVSPTPLIVTLAHGESDYLLSFDATVSNAFGPVVGGMDNYFYVEIDLVSGQPKFGITTVEPVVATTAPTAALPGMTWFDLTTNQTFVRNSTNTKFIATPRVILGKATGGNLNNIQMKDIGSQVGLNVEAYPGFIMYDEALRPLRTSTGTLLTTDTPVRIRTTGTSGVLATPTNAFVPVRANESIPAMSLVYFSGADSVSLASSHPAFVNEKTPVGIIKQDLAQNEVGVITQSGEISYDQWNFTEDQIGQPLYCGDNGELVFARPQGLQVYRVGVVKNSNTILFRIDSETQPQVYSAAGAIIHGNAPIVATESTNVNNENVTTISMEPSTPDNDGYMSAEQAAKLELVDEDTTAIRADVVALQVGKSDVGHTHVAADITDLQALLDGKLDATANFDTRYALIGHNHDDRYSLLGHTHSIAQIDFLQDALNSKAPVVHTHPLTQIVGLEDALAQKAAINHTHVISNISGLQTALDGKAPTNHTHIITQINGLQEALDARALVNHIHAMSDITGLSIALDAKAPLNHTHALTSLSDVNLTLNDGWVISWDVGSGKFITKASSSGVTTLAALSDTNVIAPAEQATLAFVDNKWTSRPGMRVYEGYPANNTFIPTKGIAFTGSAVSVSEPELGVISVDIGIPDIDLSGYYPITGGELQGDMRTMFQVIGSSLSNAIDQNGYGGSGIRITKSRSDNQGEGRVEFVTLVGGNTMSVPNWIGTIVDGSGSLIYYSDNSHRFTNDIEIGTFERIGQDATYSETFETILSIKRTGSIVSNNDAGMQGYVLTSGGPNAPVTWTRPFELPPGGVSGNILTFGSGGAVWTEPEAPFELPAGGSIGDVLTTTAQGPMWMPQPEAAEDELPTGGITGQILVKSPTGVEWGDIPTPEEPAPELPQNGAPNQVLTIGMVGPEWRDVPTELPTGGAPGFVLKQNSSLTPVWSQEFALPTGASGQILALSGTSPVWQDQPPQFSLPIGIEGQYLSLNSSNQPVWSALNISDQLANYLVKPAGGSSGQYLTLDSSNNPTWTTLDLSLQLQGFIPRPEVFGETGDVLTLNAEGTAVWETPAPSSGGGNSLYEVRRITDADIVDDTYAITNFPANGRLMLVMKNTNQCELLFNEGPGNVIPDGAEVVVSRREEQVTFEGAGNQGVAFSIPGGNRFSNGLFDRGSKIRFIKTEETFTNPDPESEDEFVTVPVWEVEGDLAPAV